MEQLQSAETDLGGRKDETKQTDGRAEGEQADGMG
jgi:hypothetical protein